MKIFMVFVALSLVFLCAFSFVADLNNFALMEKSLKTMAEECACGSALMTDSAMASYGYLEIDMQAAKDACGRIVNKLAAAVPAFSRGTISVDSIDVGENYAAVKLSYYQQDDLFRLPFFTKHGFSREAEYRWE